MRKPTLIWLVFSLAAASAVGVVGCTALLGSFEVSATGGETGDGAPCTPCNGQCVDTTTSATNCGACGAVCAGGQICAASACKCPSDQAFCNAQCVHADRAHCGPTCGPCQNDEVCNEACVAAPLPAFESGPRETTGWMDPANQPIVFKLKATGIPGTIYECRTAPDASFTPSTPEWKPCDGTTGAAPTHTPTANSAAPQGTYRTEYRYRSDTYRSTTIARVYYVHHKLDGVATCPRAGQAADGPHFTDDQYFQAALTFSTSYPGQFVVSDNFPAPGSTRADTFFLHNPWIKIPFVQAVRLPTMSVNTWPAGVGVPALINYNFEDWSLRHLYVLNAARSLLLVKRQYVNPSTKDCKNLISFGSITSGDDAGKHPGLLTFGPDGAGRGPHYMDCEAFVLNSHGAALCMGKNPAGTAPEPQVIDKHANPGIAGTGTLNAAAAGAVAATATFPGGTSFLTQGVQASYYIQIPTPGNPYPGAHWYKITTVSATGVTFSPPLKIAIPAGTPFRFYYNSLVNTYVAPSGYAKLSGNGHNWAARGVTPSFHTKCETAGCDSGKAWMTYLPP